MGSLPPVVRASNGKTLIPGCNGRGWRCVIFRVARSHVLDNPSACTLLEAGGDSADGTTIVSFGTYPKGFTEVFIAVIPAPCPADITGDGTVNVIDLLEILAAWGDCQ